MKIITLIKIALIPTSLMFLTYVQADPVTKEYTAYEIQTFLSGYQESVSPIAMNETGQVTGYTSTTGESSAFLFDGHETIHLGPLSSSSSPKDINAYNQIVGLIHLNGFSHIDAFLYENNTLTNLNIGDSYSQARGLNDSGTIVGEVKIGTELHAFIYESLGNLSNLNVSTMNNTDGILETAIDINNAGQIIGTAITDQGRKGYMIENNVASLIPLSPININEQGLIVGWSYQNTVATASAYHDGVLHSLGNRGQAKGVNDSGVIVGLNSGGEAGFINQFAFIYDSLNGVRDLNDLVKGKLCCKLIDAIEVNNSGQILAIGRKVKGGKLGSSNHALILNPITR